MYRPPPISEHPPFVEIMRKLKLEPDPWQMEVLDSTQPQMLLNCCRQAGKSTVVAVRGLVGAMFKPMSNVIVVSRSHRQSKELLKTMAFFFELLNQPLKKSVSSQEIRLDNWSRIVSVPCREDTIRGYSQVDLLIVDEAARVPDDLYRAIRPMLAVSQGRLICLSTPYGKRGFFWDAWANGGDDWARIEIPARKCPRISSEFLERETRAMGESWFRQEYCCSFEALEGLVYPDFGRCVVSELPKHVQLHLSSAVVNKRYLPAESERASWVGGIDFGFRNPFAAIWGLLDRDDILWLLGEHYSRQKPIAYHAQKLPKNVTWYADPSGASEISELSYAGFVVRRGTNAKRTGIAALSARIEDGTLRILEGRCPNLLREAGLYRYADGEEPENDNNHALDALRYLISRIDAYRLGRRTHQEAAEAEAKANEQKDRPVNPFEARMNNERYWFPIG